MKLPNPENCPRPSPLPEGETGHQTATRAPSDGAAPGDPSDEGREDRGTDRVARLEAALAAAEAKLREARSRYRTLAESHPGTISRFDRDLRHLEIEADVQSFTGHPAAECVGRTLGELGLPAEIIAPWEEAARQMFATGSPQRLELTIPTSSGPRVFDCRLLPEGTGGHRTSILSVDRDITVESLDLEERSRARRLAEAMREATVDLTRSLDRATVLATLLDRLRTLLAFDRASVHLVENSALWLRAIHDGERVASLPADPNATLDPREHPIVHQILSSGSAVMIPDIRDHPEWSLPADPETETSWMGVPLFARGSVVGLFAMSKREPGYFKREHLELAQALSSQASVAVENAILYEQMQASTRRMRSLSRRLVQAQENERRHIARELHDEAGQILVSLRYGLRLLERELDVEGGAAGLVADLVEQADKVMENLHRLAADLRPVSLDHLGLEAALRQYAHSVEAKVELDVEIEVENGFDRLRLPNDVATAIYRMVQEAVTNVVRHAQATRVDIRLDLRGDRVVLTLEDDGAGMSTDQIGTGDHLGLLGIRERAEALGGSLRIESKPERGTKLIVEVESADTHPDR